MPRFVTPEGATVEVPDQHVESVLRQGYRPSTGVDAIASSDARLTQARVDSRGPLDQVGAAALGVARGATFGASDVLVGDPELTGNLKADYPVTSGLSEVAGAIAPALLTGGAGATGTVARMLPAGRAAMGAERLAALGAGRGAFRQVAASAGAGAFEGAAQTAGSYLSAAALEDKDLSAEAFLAEAGHGAIFGGAVGGGLAAAERGMVAARGLFPKSAGSERAVRKAAEDVDAALTKALRVGDDQAKRGAQALDVLAAGDPDLVAAAQARIVEGRALKAEADAAAAQSRAESAAIRLDRVRNPPPKSSRVRKPKGTPADGVPVTAIEDAPALAPRPLPEDEIAGQIRRRDSLEPFSQDELIPTDPAARQRWDEFPGRGFDEADPGYSARDAGTSAGSGRARSNPNKSAPGADVIPIRADMDAGDGDLMALLAGTKQRLDGGEGIGALNAEARAAKPSAITPLHEAMAEIDPKAAKIVEAVRAQEQAADAIRSRFTVRDADGTQRVAISEMRDLTVGRIKQAYKDANPSERAAILDAIGPDKAKALTEIVEGRAKFDKWYKNKAHTYEDGSYNPAEAFPLTRADLEMRAPAGEPVGPDAPFNFGAADDLDVAPELGAHAETITANKAAAEISDYERATAGLADALGPAAPPEAVAFSADVGKALAEQERKAIDRLAMMADDGDLAKAAETISLPGASTATAPAKRGGMMGMAADFAAANEALQAVGVNTPFDVDKIPIVGPLLGVFAKFRAASTVLGKAGFRVPLSGEARVAGAASKTRDRMADAVDGLLARGAKVAGKARVPAVAVSWRAADVIGERLFNDGKRRKTDTMAEAMLARSEELQAAAANPSAVRGGVRQAMRDVRDPDVIAAAVAVAERKIAYLSKHAPQPPMPDLLSRSTWRPSPTDVERFARRVRAANDPTSVLRDVGAGRVTAEAAEALREVYPRLYAEAQARLIERAAELRESLPHALVVRLAVLFDAPLVRSLEPAHMAAIQSAGAQAQPQQAPAPGGMAMPPPAGAPNVSDLYMTADQRRG